MMMSTVPSEPTHAVDPLEQLSRVVSRTRAELLAVALREGLDAQDALECVQDALCGWLSRASAGEAVRSDAELVASLKVTIRNGARNGRRRHHRLKPHLPIEPAREEVASPLRDAEQLLSEAETALRLKYCVAELREVERAVITLRLLEERSGEDVAATMGLSRSHVDVLVHRAKSTLRVCMQAPNCSDPSS
jgi:RNA polymerase sigma-70 factor (ECF subfamily)